jgi:hypothetical protein
MYPHTLSPCLAKASQLFGRQQLLSFYHPARQHQGGKPNDLPLETQAIKRQDLIAYMHLQNTHTRHEFKGVPCLRRWREYCAVYCPLLPALDETGSLRDEDGSGVGDLELRSVNENMRVPVGQDMQQRSAEQLGEGWANSNHGGGWYPAVSMFHCQRPMMSLAPTHHQTAS